MCWSLFLLNSCFFTISFYNSKISNIHFWKIFNLQKWKWFCFNFTWGSLQVKGLSCPPPQNTFSDFGILNHGRWEHKRNKVFWKRIIQLCIQIIILKIHFSYTLCVICTLSGHRGEGKCPLFFVTSDLFISAVFRATIVIKETAPPPS